VRIAYRGMRSEGEPMRPPNLPDNTTCNIWHSKLRLLSVVTRHCKHSFQGTEGHRERCTVARRRFRVCSSRHTVLQPNLAIHVLYTVVVLHLHACTWLAGCISFWKANEQI
jgi:hypothetical protein